MNATDTCDCYRCESQPEPITGNDAEYLALDGAQAAWDDFYRASSEDDAERLADSEPREDE
jgi:hypothetical protein